MHATKQHCIVEIFQLYSVGVRPPGASKMDPNESSRFPDFHVVASKAGPNESSRFPDFQVVASKMDPNETSRFPGSFGFDDFSCAACPPTRDA